MMKVYEYVGYMNEGNGGNGQWFGTFPYKMDGSNVEPRTTFQDTARGIKSSENWQAFVIQGEFCPIEKWVGKVPEGADYITTFPIQRITFDVISLPTLILDRGNEFSIREGLCNYYTMWKRETVSSFVTKEGKVMSSLYKVENLNAF